MRESEKIRDPKNSERIRKEFENNLKEYTIISDNPIQSPRESERIWKSTNNPRGYERNPLNSYRMGENPEESLKTSDKYKRILENLKESE